MKSLFLYFPLQSSLDYSSCHATQENSWPLWRYQSFRVHQDRRRVCGGVAAVLKSCYFMVVEPDKGFTILSSSPWQLDNNFSALFPHCHFSSFNIYPLDLFHPVSPSFCSPLSLWPTPLTSISLLCFPTPTFSSGSVGHNDCPGRTGLEDIPCQWGEWKSFFFIIRIFKVKPIILMGTTKKWKERHHRVAPWIHTRLTLVMVKTFYSFLLIN